MAMPTWADPKIYDLALELRATKGWSYDRIAEYMFHNKGVHLKDDPTRPVVKSTVLRWIRKGQVRLDNKKAYRYDVEKAIAGLELDMIKEIMCDLIEDKRLESVDDVLRWSETMLKLRKERSTTFGLYAQRRKQVEHTGEVGVEVRKMDPATEEMLEKLEAQVAQDRAERAAAQGWSGES